MGAPVAFFEVSSADHERAQTFHGELFGWHVAADPAMGGHGRFAVLADPDGNPVGLWG